MDKAIDQNNFLYFISVITTQNVGRTLEELVSSCFFYASQFKYPSVTRVLCYHKE